MKVLVVSDSYKGSLSSTEVIRAIQEAGERCGLENVVGMPVADGGEGTLDAILSALHGETVPCSVTDPLGRTIPAYFGLIDGCAVIEMATASGLTLLTSAERNPLYTTSYGLGELISHALDRQDVTEIIVAIGGSATNDGGVGMAQALGLQALDASGQEVALGGGHLRDIVKLDASKMHPRIKEVPIRVMCDVMNPLCGPSGASAIYGPQKGAAEEMVQFLDENLKHLAERIRTDLGKDVADLPGGGAAGGVGAALVGFCGARLESGIDVLLDLFGFEDAVHDVDLIITGEGQTDAQTTFGKAVAGVARRAKPLGKPVICLSGSIGGDLQPLYQCGVDACFSICPGPVSLEDALKNAHAYVVDAAENILRLYQLGRK